MNGVESQEDHHSIVNVSLLQEPYRGTDGGDGSNKTHPAIGVNDSLKRALEVNVMSRTMRLCD